MFQQFQGVFVKKNVATIRLALRSNTQIKMRLHNHTQIQDLNFDQTATFTNLLVYFSDLYAELETNVSSFADDNNGYIL